MCASLQNGERLARIGNRAYSAVRLKAVSACGIGVFQDEKMPEVYKIPVWADRITKAFRDHGSCITVDYKRAFLDYEKMEQVLIAFRDDKDLVAVLESWWALVIDDESTWEDVREFLKALIKESK